MNKKVLHFPSSCSKKALKFVSLNGFQRYSFLAVDVIIKKRRTTDDVTKILMTLQLKYRKAFLKIMFGIFNDEMLTFTNRMIEGFIIMRKYKFL
jgi:hypothetical protein